jgi:hypothetical protein
MNGKTRSGVYDLMRKPHKIVQLCQIPDNNIP